MTRIRRLFLAASLAAAALAPVTMLDRARAASTDELNRDADRALRALYAANPAAASLGRSAKAVLIFPNIYRVTYVYGAAYGKFDGAYGEGVLETGSTIDSYYHSIAGTWRVRSDAGSYRYAVFLMSDDAVSAIQRGDSWQIGAGPSVVIVDDGVARDLAASAPKNDVYAFIFDQRGQAAAISIDGMTISRL